MSKYNLDGKTGISSLFSGKNLNKMVKVGTSLEIKHFKMFDYINAYIADKTDTTLKLVTKEELIETFFFRGDPVVMNYSCGKELFVISGEINDIHSISPLELSITTNCVEKLKDLRKYERYYVSLMANLTIPGFINRVFAVVKNISSGGIKVNCSEYLSTEESITVEVVLDRINTLTFKGAIVRRNKCNGYYEYGIEINGISESNLKCLHHYLNWLNFES